MDLSNLSTKDLEYIAAGKMDKVSDAALKQLAAMPNTPSNAPEEMLKPSTSVFEPKVPYSAPAEAARSFAQGVTLSFADELEAALRSGAVSGKDYEKIRNQLRAQQGQFKSDIPGSAYPLEIAGGVAMPLGLYKSLKGASTGVQSGVTGESLLGQMARGTGVGATTGAISGVGAATDNIGKEAAIGAGFGGVVGGTVPVVLKGAGSLIKNVLNASGIGEQETAASKMIMNRLKKEDLTPDEAQKTLDELRAIGIREPVIADLGKNLQDLAYSAYVVPSSRKAATANFLESRMIDQPNDIVSGLVKKAGLGKNVSGYEYLQFLSENQQKAAQSAYPDAYKKSLDARDFRKYVDRPVFQDAYQEAVKRAGVYGDRLPDLEQIRNAQFVPTDVLHKIKIGLDRVVESNTDAVTGKVTAYGRDVANVRKEFNDLIKEKNIEYRKANAEFSDNERIRSSFETGQKYQKLDYKEALDKLKKMNDAEKEAFRLGMMADVNSRLENFKGGDFTRQIFKSDKQKSLMRYAFTDEAKYKEFVSYVDALGRQTKTGQALMGGSQTGERLATREGASEMGQIAQSAASGGLTGGALAAAKSLFARTKGISGETSAELQKRLFSVDPIEQTAILQELKRRTQNKPVGLIPGSAALGTTYGLLGN